MIGHRALAGRPLARVGLTLAALSLVAAACGGSSDDAAPSGGEGVVKADPAAEGTPVTGGTVTIGVEAETSGWQPCVDSPSESGTMVFYAIYDHLTARSTDGVYRPWLAESLTSNPALTEWTLKLRPGVKFHDGTDLDSAVLKSNFDDAKAPTSRCAGLLAPVTSMTIIDPLTVSYQLNGPYGPFPSLLASSYPYSPANAAKWGKDVSSHPVGTGPFVFDSWERDSKLTVKKNPNYWQKGLPYLDSVVFKPIPDEDARLASVTSGDVDVMFTLRQQYVRQARELGDAVKRYEFNGNNSGSSIYNVAQPPVDDKRVRQAIAHALNQKDLIKILGGEGISPETTQFFSKDSPWYSQKVADAYPKFDVNASKVLVAQYVNDPARSDKKPVGSPIEITYNCPPDPTLIALAQGFQQMVGVVGIKADLKQVEQATHINNAVGKPPYTQADYTAQCWRNGGQADPDALLHNSLSGPENQAANVTNFSTPAVQALVKIGRESADQKVRYDAYEKVGLILADEVPITWTGSTAASTVAKANIKGLMNWRFPDGTTKGTAEQSVTRFGQVWVTK